jgi:hypothetical protein
MSQKLTPDDAQSIIAARANPYALNTSLAPVDLATIRERINPQGPKIAAKDLVGQRFTIVEVTPFKGTLPGSREIIYHVKAVDERGELFHTTIGGKVAAQWLDDLNELTAAWTRATEMGDDERAQQLEGLGAGRPVTVKLVWLAQGENPGYYTFE